MFCRFQNHGHCVLTRPPRIGAGAEVVEVTIRVDPDGRCVSFAAGDPGGKGIVLSAGKLIDVFHIVLAPIDDLLTGPVVEIIEVELP